MKKIYACFCTDVIHEGHINIINEAQKYGDLTVGVLCDSAMLRYLRFPSVDEKKRMEMFGNIPGVGRVVLQKEIMYDAVINELRPDYVIHGTNWIEEPMASIRENVLGLLAAYGGELIEVPYTYSERTAKAERRQREKIAMPEFRRKRLRLLLGLRPIVKAIEVHSGLTGLIAEKTVVRSDDGLDQFDAMWVSSLCDSTAKGKPDIELVDMTSRFRTINDIMEVTTKPVIFDGDTGGQIEHFVYTVRSLERLGVSAVIIEDKTGLKKNSLFGTDVAQTQDSVEHFCAKIRAGKAAQLSDEFMVIARVESLVLGRGVEDAVSRALAYIDAGADGIMASSRTRTPEEFFGFCRALRERNASIPIVSVPSSYSSVTDRELAANGANIVIYANHLTRSAYPAMQKTAEDILKNHRSSDCEAALMPIKDILTLID